MRNFYSFFEICVKKFRLLLVNWINKNLDKLQEVVRSSMGFTYECCIGIRVQAHVWVPCNNRKKLQCSYVLVYVCICE